MEVEFADATRFEQQGGAKQVSAWTSMLPSLDSEQAVLAVAVSLPKGDVEWRYSPVAVETPVEAWIVRQWREESTRPQGDSYYGDAPS